MIAIELHFNSFQGCECLGSSKRFSGQRFPFSHSTTLITHLCGGTGETNIKKGRAMSQAARLWGAGGGTESLQNVPKSTQVGMSWDWNPLQLYYFKCHPHEVTFEKESAPRPVLTGSIATFPCIFPFLLVCLLRTYHFSHISPFNFPLSCTHRGRSQPQSSSNLLPRKLRVLQKRAADTPPGYTWLLYQRQQGCSEIGLLSSGQNRFRRHRKPAGDHF